MGRNKLKIQKLETSSNRQITYSKRRTGIMKKAKELSILCDVDVLLVTFSTSGKPSLFLGQNSTFDDIIKKYGNVNPQDRNKRRLESLEALKKAFKNVNHEVNMAQLRDQGSEPVEEMRHGMKNYIQEINEAVNILGPLAKFRNIGNIADLNEVLAMENKIKELIAGIQAKKCERNQLRQLNEESGSYWYNMSNGQQFTHPGIQLPRRDLTKLNMGYEARRNYFQQSISWPQSQKGGTYDSVPTIENSLCVRNGKIDSMMVHYKMPECKGGVDAKYEARRNYFQQSMSWPQFQMGGTYQTFINKPADSVPNTETSLCFENGKMDSMMIDSKMPENKGGVDEKCFKDMFPCQTKEECFSNVMLNDITATSNESIDFVASFFEPSVSLPDNFNFQDLPLENDGEFSIN